MAQSTTGIPVFYFRPDVLENGVLRQAETSDPAYELGKEIEEIADAEAATQ